MTRVQDAISALRAVAFSEGRAGIWRRCASRLFSRGRFGRWEIDLTRWVPPPPPTGPVAIRRVCPEELARLRRSARAPLGSEFYADILHGARCCYLAWCEGQIAHISWLFTSEDVTRQIRLQPGEVELNFAYTIPTCRGRGLLCAVETAILRDAQASGITRAYTHVAVDNTASVRGVRKTGFTLTGVVTLTWILGRCLAHFTPVPRGRPLMRADPEVSHDGQSAGAKGRREGRSIVDALAGDAVLKEKVTEERLYPHRTSPPTACEHSRSSPVAGTTAASTFPT